MIRPIFGKDISLVSVADYEMPKPKFKAYPNPASDRIYLAVDERRNYNLQVFNCIGEMVHDEKITNSKVLDVSAFSRGIYMIRLVDTASNSFSVQKLILQYPRAQEFSQVKSGGDATHPGRVPTYRPGPSGYFFFAGTRR